MKLKNYAILLSFLLGGSAFVKAQDIALKSNILYDASGTINLGAEVGLAPRWTLDVSGNYNGWVRSHGRTWKHWMLQPEARYWFCDRFTGHFVGVHAHGGQYNVGNLKNDISFLGSDLSKLSDRRYQGWFVGGRYCLRLFVDSFPLLERGGRNRCGLCLYPFRCLSLCRLRHQTD